LYVRHRLSFPKIYVFLGLFCVWTVVAVIASPEPAGGTPQIRKLIVFLFIPLLYSALKTSFANIYWLMAAWGACATASGIWGLVQFVQKYLHAQAAGQDFYTSYIGERITGFESHWMTFGGLQLSVFSLLLAQLLFSNKRLPRFAYLSLPILLAAILLGATRSIWLATVPATGYLLWSWRPKMLLAIPLVVALSFVVAPSFTRERARSLFAPREDVDSNRHRIVTFRTGIEMIKAHPLLGLGPEQIPKQFDAYVPADIRRPLPVGYYGHLHNIYVQYAAERGIPALILLLGLIGMCLRDWLGAARMLGKERSQELFVLRGAIAVMLGILAGGFFEHNLGDSEILMMFSSTIGVAYAAAEQVLRPRTDVSLVSPSAVAG
jgi:O-antigen ligase